MNTRNDELPRETMQKRTVGGQIVKAKDATQESYNLCCKDENSKISVNGHTQTLETNKSQKNRCSKKSQINR